MARTHGFWSIFLIVFLLGFSNIFSSPLNNWNIACFQVVFCLVSFLFLRPISFCGAGRVGWVFVFIGVSVIFSNVLAAWDAVGQADWCRVFGVLMHIAFALTFFFWFSMRKEAVHWFVVALLVSVFIYFLVLLSFWNGLDNPYSYSWVSSPPLFRNIRHLGYFLCVGTVIAAWAVFAYSGVRCWLAWGVYLLVVSMLLWSGGRGAFLAACGGLAMLGVKFVPKKNLKHWGFLLSGMLLAFGFSALFDVGQDGMGWLAAVSKTANSSTLDQLSSSRLNIWMYLLPRISERLWFGWGGEGFRSVWEKSDLIQAHNGILQLLIEWGVVGAGLIGGFLTWLTVKGGRAYWKLAPILPATNALPLGISLVVALLLLSAVDGVFYHGTPMAFLMIGCGAVGASIAGYCKATEYRRVVGRRCKCFF